MSVLSLIGYPLMCLAAIQFGLAVVCFIRARRDQPITAASGVVMFFTGCFSLSSGFVYVRAAQGLDYSFYYKMAWTGFLILPAMMQISYYLRRKVSRAVRISTALLYPFWFGILYFLVTTDYVDIAPEILFPYVEIIGKYEMLIRSFAALQLLWAIYHLFRALKESRGIQKQRTGYLLLGLIIYAISGLILATVSQVWIGVQFDPALVSYFSVPLILLTFYAVYHHRLFDIRLVLSNISSAIFLTLVFGSFQFGLFKLTKQVVGDDVGLILAGLGTAILGFTTPFISKVRMAASNLFLRKKYDYPKLLKESSESLVSVLNLDDLLRRFVKLTKHSMDVSQAAFYMQQGDEFVLRHSVGVRAEGSNEKITLSVNHPIIQWLQEKKQVFVKEEQFEILPRIRFNRLIDGIDTTSCEIIVPILLKGTITGFLVMGGKDNRDAFLQDDLNFLETLSSQVAVAIENAQLFSEATTDGMTGLYHHKHFKARLKAEFVRAQRHGHTVGLLIVDVDHFKKVNDTYGHLGGDEVLKGVAKILANSFRAEDVVARYGGEEFAVLLLEPTSGKAFEVAERLRAKIEKALFPGGIRVTASIGVFVLSKAVKVTTEIDMIAYADEALYRAKNAGRNQVVESDGDETQIRNKRA